MLTRRRKTRKLHRNQRGGNENLDDELVETLDELNLLYIPSIDDGNCFFYTLESFFSIRKRVTSKTIRYPFFMKRMQIVAS